MICPLSGEFCPCNNLRRVDLPAPLGPTKAVKVPGFIATEMTDVLDEKVVAEWVQGIPLKRAGQPEEVADLCVFLGSDRSTYITGQVYNICGGMSM